MIETIINNFHLEKIMWIIKKNIAFMIIIAAVGGVAGGLYASVSSSTSYRASVSFYVYSNPEYIYDSTVNISGSEFTVAKNLVQSYIRVLKSDTVLQKVISSTDIGYSTEYLANMIGSSIVDNTAIFYVYVYDSNPYNAMELANAIADIAPDEISRIVKSGGIEVVDYAKLPQYPYSSTSITKYVLIGFIGAGGLSAIIFLLIGLLDTTIRRRYELRLMFNIPILGDIPLIEAPNQKTKVSKILKEDSPFAVKESYNTIRTNMLFTGNGEKCPVYVITSAEQDEGKSLTSINIAVCMAEFGKKVLVIDGDMRNASIHRILDIENEDGLSNYLAGLSDSVKINDLGNGVDVISAGTIPPNPAALLANERMDKLLETMKKYDCIIIDQPPVGIVSDALVLTQKVTGYILIVRAGHSKMNKEKEAVQKLEQVDANICGFIFNGLHPKSQDYSYRKYSYEYTYGSKVEEKKKKGRK